MERATIAIGFCAADEEEALQYLDGSTKQGNKLTITTLKTLSYRLNNTGVVQVLKNITENQQTLPEYLLDQLVGIFEPKGNQIELVEIFINIYKNNQNISIEHSAKLKQALNNKILTEKVLLIFTMQGQKSEYLPNSVIDKISQKFLETKDQKIQTECLSAMCSIIQVQKCLDQKCIEEVLRYTIMERDFRMVRSSANAFSILSKEGYIHSKSTQKA